jgi:restriction endonuclease S subunit
MNCFLHGIEDFRIVRGDTLSEPKFVQGDHLMAFDVVLANPPYSIKQWDRESFSSDCWGRNLYGTPPQGRADYAFWQHILCSLARKTGRCAILFPHGVLFRQEESEMRRKLIESDVIECVLGLGPNLFYNSPMEACVVICRLNKPKARKGRILFINAINDVTRERAQSFLTDEHIERIVTGYKNLTTDLGFTCVATLEEIRSKNYSLSIPLYVDANAVISVGAAARHTRHAISLGKTLAGWLASRDEVAEAMTRLIPRSTPRPSGGRSQFHGEINCELFNNKSKWRRVRFGDVVENVNDTESDPLAAGIRRFIGMEHLEPGSLHVRDWGNVADGTTFTRRCRPGHVLFGKRRAYQRKVAVAEFEAVVSGDIYVLAPKNDRLLPDLLPFICLSERFFQHAVGTSAGSLSPRTNWSSLASFELDLPPLDQQKRIVRILIAADNALSFQMKCHDAGVALMQSERSEIFTGRIGHAGIQQFKVTNRSAACDLVTVADVSKVVRGASPRPKGDPRYYGGTIPRVMVADITRDKKYITPSIDFLTEEGSKLSRPVPKGTLILVCSGTPQQVGLPGILTTDACIHDGIIALTDIDEKCRIAWLFHLFSFFQSFMDSTATHGGTFVNLTTDIVKGIQVGLPPITLQDEHVARLTSLEKVIGQLDAQIQLLKAVFQSLVDSI